MKTMILIVALIFLAALGAACAPQSLPENIPLTELSDQVESTPTISASPMLEVAPTASETPTLVVAPTATPEQALLPTSTQAPATPTETVEVAFSFQELIRFGEGGGGAGCFPSDAASLPVVTRDSGSTYPKRQEFMACLLGLPGGELVDLLLIDPQGREIPWMTVQIPDQFVTDYSGNVSSTLIELPGFQSLALGSSDWQLVARFSGGEISGSLFNNQFNYWWDENEKVVTHSRIPTGAVSNPLDPTLRTPYRERETIYLQGVNFTPNSYLPLALYQGAFDLQFVRAFTVNTDSQGRFETTLKIDPEFEDGFYSVIPSEMFDPQSLSSPISGAFATFEVLTQLPYAACPDAPLSNLVVGDRAKMVDDVANNLRASSGQYAENPVIGQVQPGEEVLVLGGPACDSGYTWWLVYDENNRLVGWTAEGDFNELWLAPLE
jgi:hypothetical protein